MAETPTTMNLLSETSLNIFKIHIMIHKDGLGVLHQLLYWGYKGGIENMLQYMKRNYSNNVIKSIFNSSQINILRNYNSFEEFDLTLTYLLFQRVCGLKDKSDILWSTANNDCIESILYSIKCHRNEFVFRSSSLDLSIDQMSSEATSLTNLYIDLVKKACNLFNKQDETEKLIYNITNTFSKTKDMSILGTEYKKYFSEIASEELRANYESVKLIKLRIWPLQYKGYTVKDIFSSLNLENENGEVINEKHILSYKAVDGTIPDIIISGNTGSGKTTLLKLLLQNWCDKCGDSSDFDLLFYVECRNSEINCIDTLFSNLLPELLTEVKPSEIDYLKKTLLSQNVLFLIDGIDEANTNVLKLLKELFTFDSKSLRFICTTRIYKFEELSTLMTDANRLIQHFAIQKFPPTKWMSFVDKVLAVTMADLPRKEVRDRIYLFLNAQDNNLWGIDSPFLLTCIAVLGAEDYDLGAFTSKSSMYSRIEDLIIEKITQWIIISNEAKCFDRTLIKQKCLSFMKSLDQVAHNCFMTNTITIDNSAKHILAQECHNLDLPENEILSSFLNCKLSVASGKEMYNYCFHHKSILEYHAARYVAAHIQSSGMTFLTELSDQNLDISALLSFVVELLQDDNCLKTNSEVFVSLANNIGVKSIQQWLELMSDEESAKCFAPFVAKFLQDSDMVKWNVKDKQLPALYKLLQYNSPKTLQITVASVVSPVGIPFLKEVINLVSKKNILVELNINYHFVTYNDDHLDQMVAPILDNENCMCSLLGFRGSLNYDYIPKLPSSLKYIMIRTNKDQITVLQEHLTLLNNLEILEIHLDVNEVDTDPVTLPTLTPCDVTEKTLLCLPRVTDKNCVWAAKVISKLFKGNYFKIKLFDSCLTAEGTEVMMREMVSLGVQVHVNGWFEVRSNYNLNDEEQTKLQSIARDSVIHKLFWRVQ